MTIISVKNILNAFGTLIGDSILGVFFNFPAWVLKILAIIFSFQTSNKLKNIQ